MDRLTALDPDTSTDAGLQDMIDESAKFSNACLDRSGAVFGHVDTISAAKDLDVMRAVLGDDVLHYLGFSYGTKLGATYAALFPDRAGRLVLDGALDPTLSEGDIESGQAAGFEGALRAYVADCLQGSGCPLTGSVDNGMTQIRALLDRARPHPLETGTDRELTQVAGVLRHRRDALLAELLVRADAGPDGSDPPGRRLDPALVLRRLLRPRRGRHVLDELDRGVPRGELPRRPHAPRTSTTCAPRPPRSPRSPRPWARSSPTAAPSCGDWSVPEVGALDDYSAQGAPPILVVGTTNDPATPYKWAQSLATTLSSGVLLTYEGEGHTAYARRTRASRRWSTRTCDGTVPDDGTRC